MPPALGCTGMPAHSAFMWVSDGNGIEQSGEDAMIKRQQSRGSKRVKVSFAVAADDSRLPASVVGDFNEWQEGVDVFRRRSNQTASAVVELQAGRSYRFRYRSADGSWFDDESADGFEPNEFGTRDCVIEL
jgi:1,4-alpha-glucan branching enzyme